MWGLLGREKKKGRFQEREGGKETGFVCRKADRGDHRAGEKLLPPGLGKVGLYCVSSSKIALSFLIHI